MIYCIKPELTVENIYKSLSSFHIFKYYCKNFNKVGVKFYSEFRTEDVPSCCIDYIREDLLYTDFGTGESYRAISYVMRKYSISFPDALDKINTDFNLGLLGINSKIKNSSNTDTVYINKLKNLEAPIFEDKVSTVIRIKRREDWRKIDLEYWYQYGWTKEMLEKADISPISHYWIKNHKGNRRFVTGRRLAFSIDYYWNEGTFRRKIYLPGSSNRKSFFFSNVDNTIVQGVKLLPKEGGKVLFVTSSIKDCGVFWRLGYNAVAPNNEGSFLPEKFYNKIKHKWDRIIIWYDNDWDKKDNPGVTCAKRLAEQYRTEYFYNPDNEPKDPSDFIKKYGVKDGLHKFNNIILDKCRL